MFFFFKSFDFGVVFNLVQFLDVQPEISFLGFKLQRVDLIVIFLFLGAIGKSAQLGLHT
jgi:NADH-ubiquinone oxidoreductase chain 5